MSIYSKYYDPTAIDPYYTYPISFDEPDTNDFTYYLSGCSQPQISILSMKNGLLICEDQICNFSKDPVAAYIYNTAKSVYNFFKSEFNLCGIDGKGKFPPIYVGWNEHNASWYCQNTLLENEQCAFIFHNDYALQPRVIAHEYVHGIVKSLRSLHYVGQAGALNESLADVLAIAFDHWNDPTTVDDWTNANRDLSKKINMRSFRKNKDAHDNSLIPSHAFYRAVQRTGDNSWGIIAQIWFRAFQNLSLPNATFKEFAQATINEAYKFDGIEPELVNKITQSWNDVGISLKPSNYRPKRNHYYLTR